MSSHMNMSEHLRQAARRLLDAEGPSALSVRKLAAAADVAPMTIYHQFKSKDGIVDQLVCDGFQQLHDTLLAMPESGEAAVDAVQGGMRYRRLALDHPHMYSLMFERSIPGYEPSAETMAVAGSSFEVLVGCMRRGQAAGEVIDGDPVELAERLWAAMHGLVALELHNYGFVANRSSHFEATLTTVMRGLRPS
jgi:AcrR family transcriptional regulator